MFLRKTSKVKTINGSVTIRNPYMKLWKTSAILENISGIQIVSGGTLSLFLANFHLFAVPPLRQTEILFFPPSLYVSVSRNESSKYPSGFLLAFLNYVPFRVFAPGN